MKEKLTIASAMAAGIILYLICRKKFYDQNEDAASKLRHHSHEHHLTNVFAKAKKHATAKDV